MNNPSESVQAYLRTIRRCGRWFCYRSAIELSMNCWDKSTCQKNVTDINCCHKESLTVTPQIEKQYSIGSFGSLLVLYHRLDFCKYKSYNM